MFIILMGVCCVMLIAQTEEWQWAKRAGGTNADEGRSISIDADGNSYVTGHFIGTAIFGSTTLISSSSEYSDVYVGKMDPNGNWLWAKKAGGTSTDEGYGIYTDGSGNSYVIGSFRVTANFGSTTLTSYGQDDVFVAKLDPNGNWLWAKQAGGASIDLGSHVSSEANGNSYVIGSFNGTASFGSNTLTSSGSFDVFIAKLDPNGNWLWAKKAGGPSDDYGTGISNDASGNIYVTGRFEDTAAFGSISLTNSGDSDTFVAKLNTNGNWLCANKAGGTGHDIGYGITTDTYGNNYVTGCFTGTASFGNTTLTSNASAEVFVAKIGTLLYQVISPNGGENWQSGSTKTAYWSFNSWGQVNIYLSLNAGQTWINLYASPLDAEIGRFSFTVPYVSSSECLVKVESTANSAWYDISDALFTISSTPTSSLLLSELESTKLQAGKIYAVNWIANGISSVSLDYSIDAGLNWQSIASGLFASARTYNWTVPDTIAIGCYLKVSDAINPAVYDISDEPFTICKLEILAPNGSEIWVFPSAKTITWMANYIDNIQLEYSMDSGESWQVIAASVPASIGSYSWTLPSFNSNRCLVRAIDTSNSQFWDISDCTYTIRPQIIFTAPNGNEFLSVGSIYSILWDSTSEVSFVLIDYSIDGGANWLPVQTSNYPASVGSYDWIVPNNPSTNCLVRVRKHDDSTFYDVSDAVFTITTEIVPTIPLIGTNPETILDFGTVYLGSASEPQPLWIINPGTAALEVYAFSLNLANSPFAVQEQQLPNSIPAGDSLSIHLVFTPQVIGTTVDSLYINNNSANLPICVLGLKGIGEYVPPQTPQGVAIVIEGFDAVISWEEVTQNIYNTPITVPYYFIYGSLIPNPAPTEQIFIGYSTGTEFHHAGVNLPGSNVQPPAQYFYTVTAVVWYPPRNNNIVLDDLIGRTKEEVLRQLQQ